MAPDRSTISTESFKSDRSDRSDCSSRSAPPRPPSDSPLVVGITGASGVVYGIRLVEALACAGYRVEVIVSRGARCVMKAELGLDLPESSVLVPADFLAVGGEALGRVRLHAPEDLAAPPASGTYRVGAVAVVPASMKTCAALAHGYADNLIARAGDVALKERRPLVVVPRETPLNAIHLANLLTLARAGATILPAMPGFYHAPRRIEDLIEFVVMKIFDALGLAHDFPHRWSGPAADPESPSG